MIWPTRSLLLLGVMLAGCRSAHDVAITSYRQATAPVNRGAESSRESSRNQRRSLIAGSHQGAPLAAFSNAGRGFVGDQLGNVRDTVRTRLPALRLDRRPSPRRHRHRHRRRSTGTGTAGTKFPTAKPVEGKPGYVYSPSDPTKYVDVSGYAPGSKVKDPYSGKIFLVP